VFSPISHLKYGEFSIDLAAGLEEALIDKFTPPWNGREGKRLLTEEAEREKIDEPDGTPKAERTAEQYGTESSKPVSASGSSHLPISFRIKLGAAYYNQGIINPGVDASRHLGQHGDAVIVYLGNETEQVDSTINRTANANGSVRIVGNNQKIVDWFHQHFKLGDMVEAKVQDPQHLLLLPARR
jgi:hypothetical protein